MPPEPEYFKFKSDEDINKMIEGLSVYQMGIFNVAMETYNDNRHALFITRSFPPAERKE
jgi:hypothetical protein